MGEAKRRRREANEVDAEGLLTHIADIDISGEDRRARACATEELRDHVEMARKADGGSGLIGTRAMAAANIAGHCIIAEAIGYGARLAYLTNDSRQGWGGRIEFANPPPDLIGPPSVESIMRRALMTLSGLCGEMAARDWKPGSCADDMVVSTSQVHVLASAFGAPDRTIALRMKLWGDLIALLGDSAFGRERKMIERALQRRDGKEVSGKVLAFILQRVTMKGHAHGEDLAVALTRDLRTRLKDAPSDDEMLKEIGATMPRGAWREARGGGTEH
jgi:hypothetical protein